ncbi:aminotransferase class V-fold PLP-dependent enzyme [Oxynema sp. CENA135]|uniref:aminotransferase class V-fold PLP-dependent enzyme n=1 Tax=Oxynema sp. CENA135 TaxID=984206 RepID=UPI00190A4506|nr:aminotransferase class V-fold PLP-dependent enzyme [Oxynema sp. CENA135]MBK4730079.1 aminotransferase class V-fold PLP-dependent enzyme [Oxynema sp. CENA135]
MSDLSSIYDPSPTAFDRYWGLDPKVSFLNHGSFGACPLAVLAAQQDFQRQMERQPMHFFTEAFEPLLDAAQKHLAQFVGADPQDLAFVPNATAGVNTVLRSLCFEPGDELLTTTHEYNASRNALEFAARRAKARVVVAEIPFPVASADAIIEAVMARVSPNTKLVLLDRVTSVTALVFPVPSLVRELNERGIDTLVDGAQGPGAVADSLSEMGVAYYTGNCHKWLCAPKGSAFLYVRRDKQAQIRPLSISHGANSTRRDRTRFQLEFEWTGTDDPSAYLSVPVAIDFIASLLPGGWDAVMARNRALVLEARQMVVEALDVALPCPDELIASMASIPLPEGVRADRASSLERQLRDRYQIQTKIMPAIDRPGCVLRLSAQLYNSIEQYRKLAQALRELLAV